jgi:hypothetical protein
VEFTTSTLLEGVRETRQTLSGKAFHANLRHSALAIEFHKKGGQDYFTTSPDCGRSAHSLTLDRGTVALLTAILPGAER